MTNLSRGSHLSQRALQQTLRRVELEGLPAASSRSSQQRARRTVANQETPYGACVIDIDLPLATGPQKIAVSNPFAMLHRFDSGCPEFRSAIRALYAEQPCTIDNPWYIIFYFDAVSPSNPLTKGKDHRDTQCVYWTILELERYSQEEFWFTAAACRSCVIDELPGKMTHFMKIIMGTFFTGDDDFAITGCLLAPDGDGDKRIFLVHCITIADFNAHAEVLHSFGAKGMKPCPLCRSLVVHNRGEVPLVGPGIVPLNSTTPSDRSRRRGCNCMVRSPNRNAAKCVGAFRLGSPTSDCSRAQPLSHRSGECTQMTPCASSRND